MNASSSIQLDSFQFPLQQTQQQSQNSTDAKVLTVYAQNKSGDLGAIEFHWGAENPLPSELSESFEIVPTFNGPGATFQIRRTERDEVVCELIYDLNSPEVQNLIQLLSDAIGQLENLPVDKLSDFFKAFNEAKGKIRKFQSQFEEISEQMNPEAKEALGSLSGSAAGLTTSIADALESVIARSVRNLK